MAQVIIGGASIAVALPNFKTLKAAWPYIAAVQQAADPIDGVDAILGVVSVGAVGEVVSIEDLETRLKPAELPGLRGFLNALLVECGLAPDPDTSLGEATAAASPSAETSTPSSPNSSPPDAPGATGT